MGEPADPRTMPSPDVRVQTILDLLAIASIPAALLAVWLLLPADLQAALAFSYGEPTLAAVWTATLVHHSLEHVAGNVLAYLIVMAVLYPLYRAWGRRRLFWRVIVAVVLLTPAVTTAVDYAYLYRTVGVVGDGATSRGASGIVSALGGVLLVSLGGYVADSHTGTAGLFAAVIAFFAGATVFLSVRGAITPTAAALLALGTGLAASEFVSAEDLATPWRLLERVRRHAIASWLFLGTVTVSGVLAYAAFPTDPTAGGPFTNILAHATGFAVGCAMPAIVVGLEALARRGA